MSAKCQILEPLSFSLSLFRNLSFSWYKSKPEILVDAQLPKIHVGSNYLLSHLVKNTVTPYNITKGRIYLKK